MKYKNIILVLFTIVYSNTQLDSLSILINEEKYLESIDLADAVIKNNTDVSDKFFKKASESAFLLDEFDKSIEYLKKAISINDNKEYRENWDKIVRMRKDIEIALKMYTEEGNFDDSINEFQKLKKDYPDCALVDYNLGRIYQQEENYNKALENFQIAVKLNPYREKYQLSLNYIIGRFINEGDEYYSMRDFDSAIDRYLFAYEYMNDNSVLIFKIAKTYYFLKEYIESRKMLEDLVQLDPLHYEGYKLLGDVCNKDDNRDLALEYYLKAIEANKNYEKAYLAIGQLYHSKGDFDNALEHLFIALDLKNNYPKAHATVGIIYSDLEDYTKAIYYFEQAISYDRRDYRTMSRLAELYNILLKHDSAKKYAKDCIKVKRNFPKAYYELGIAEKGLGNRIAAISAFDTAKKTSAWRKVAQYEIDQIKKELD